MRLNLYISSTGFCSRRAADRMIESGRVKVNGKVAELGYDVQPGDKVVVNGKELVNDGKQEKVYLALNKPVGIECTTDRRVKGNIVKFVNYDKRIFPIGRLDKDSKGLILLTNDGDIVNKILRAENNHEKEYVVTVDKPLNYRFLNNLAKGVTIYNPVLDEYVKTLPCKTAKISDKTFKIIITQGMNRQIRRMCEVEGFKVTELKRVRIMNILLGKLEEGKYRHLTKDELKRLKWTLDQPVKQPKKQPIKEEKVVKQENKPKTKNNLKEMKVSSKINTKNMSAKSKAKVEYMEMLKREYNNRIKNK